MKSLTSVKIERDRDAWPRGLRQREWCLSLVEGNVHQTIFHKERTDVIPLHNWAVLIQDQVVDSYTDHVRILQVMIIIM